MSPSDTEGTGPSSAGRFALELLRLYRKDSPFTVSVSGQQYRQEVIKALEERGCTVTEDEHRDAITVDCTGMRD